jgi:hypothetical protein
MLMEYLLEDIGVFLNDPLFQAIGEAAPDGSG